MKTKKQGIPGLLTEIILLIVSLILMIGIVTVFHACVHEDGTVSVCHAAQQGVFILGIVLSAISLIQLFVRNRKANRILSALLFCGGIIAALMPGTFMRLCVMPAMRCNTMMRPFAVCCGIVLAILSLLHLILYRKKA